MRASSAMLCSMPSRVPSSLVFSAERVDRLRLCSGSFRRRTSIVSSLSGGFSATRKSTAMAESVARPQQIDLPRSSRVRRLDMLDLR